MAPLFLLFALAIQGSFIYANEVEESENVSREVLDQAVPAQELRAVDTDWIDLFMMPKGGLHPSSAVTKMEQVTKSDKPAEIQLEEMKEIANDINRAIHTEMMNLLAFAMKDYHKDAEDNSLRKKRSAESPMDSSELVMRLLKHIKSNNEYQNIAIEKMMSAQEIANKFGIEYSPDSDVLADYAAASTKQAADLASILKDASQMKNVTHEVEFIPVAEEPAAKPTENNHYFIYTVTPEDIVAHQNTPPHYEYVPDVIQARPPVTHVHYEQPQHHQPQQAQPQHYQHQQHQQTHHQPQPHFDSQLPAPQCHRNPPVTPMPFFYEPITYTPVTEFYFPLYYPEPVTTTTTIVLPIEEEPEPELVGEEFEETVSSKVTVDRGDEPGSATVNHVMTYTLSEKSHFKKPPMDSLPQQMQYYFFLM